MKEHYDPWYVRLPDGRIVKAKSTASVRHHVEGGNIPLNSMARRTSDEEWVGLGWIAEFADLGTEGRRTPLDGSDGPPSGAPSNNGSSSEVSLKGGISARLDPLRLQTVGIRGLVDELIAAFDSTVSTGKLLVAATTTLIGALAIFVVVRVALMAFSDGIWLAQTLGSLTGLLAGAVLTALLTRQTHLELSTMRPVRPAEARASAGRFVFRVFLGYVLTFGAGVGLLIVLNHAPEWVAKSTSSMGVSAHEVIVTAAWVVCICLAVGIVIVMTLGLLVAPVLIVEDCSLGDAFREWRSILREHRGRVMVYEGMALAIAVVAALPLAVPVQIALQFGALPLAASNWVVAGLPFLLHALAISPALAFLAVANLFIYLNLRYEYTPAK
jgi:hypothetical protein